MVGRTFIALKHNF